MQIGYLKTKNSKIEPSEQSSFKVVAWPCHSYVFANYIYHMNSMVSETFVLSRLWM